MSVATAGSPARTPTQHARRARIVAAATELLEDRDYDRIQIREVAERAGVALATLYRYFPSKELLYAEVLIAWSESFDARGAGRSAATDRARLRAALRRVVRAYERYPNFFRLITMLEVVDDPVTAERFATFAGHFGASLRDALRDLDPDDAEVIARLVSAELGALLRAWSMGKVPIAHVSAELDRAVDLLFRQPRPASENL